MNATLTNPKVSPTARRMAEALGVELATIDGTGPQGRIVNEDVERAADGAAPAQTAPATPAVSTPAATTAATTPHRPRGEPRVQKLTRIQQVVARRMAASRATVPEFELLAEIDMEACVRLRAELKSAAPDGAVIPSFHDFVVRACALALRDHPRANGAYGVDGFELHGHVAVGIAVAAVDALLVPVVNDADRKGLGQIAAETRALVERARDGALTTAELHDGTFTVSNLGMFGVRSFSAVINAPQAAILAVGALEQRAVVRDGAIVARHVMDVRLCCDHRILYGADAAAFLADVRRRLEAPTGLLL